MDKDNCLVKVQGEDGKEFDMLILKEFEYKSKKYAVLTEIDACGCKDDEKCDCHCTSTDKCECDDSDCNCSNDCECGCKEDKTCDCDNQCHCGCSHDDEPLLCLLEISKDEDGNEIFKSIDDEKLFNELIEEADKVLYED